MVYFFFFLFSHSFLRENAFRNGCFSVGGERGQVAVEVVGEGMLEDEE